MMLEYVKTKLLKVSFESILFEKELRKGFRLLERQEAQELRQWCYAKFSGTYRIVLNRVFSQAYV
jgi:hypothetical protein